MNDRLTHFLLLLALGFLLGGVGDRDVQWGADQVRSAEAGLGTTTDISFQPTSINKPTGHGGGVRGSVGRYLQQHVHLGHGLRELFGEQCFCLVREGCDDQNEK